MEKCKNSPWLYIDDLYKTGRNQEKSTCPTSADINLAFEIPNHRYCQRLSTIISLEKTPQELVDIDEATGSRVIEMCGKFVYSISPDTGKNTACTMSSASENPHQSVCFRHIPVIRASNSPINRKGADACASAPQKNVTDYFSKLKSLTMYVSPVVSLAVTVQR